MVTLVLVDEDGTVLGALPPFAVPSPWPQEAAEVVAGRPPSTGCAVTVLRLLRANGPEVTYLARPQLWTRTPRPPGPALARPDRPRGHAPRPYALPAVRRPASLGPVGSCRPLTPATQLRTWNLSSIWRLTQRRRGRVWLKEVPAFFAHEGALLRWLARRLPGLRAAPLAVDGGRVLLADIPGPGPLRRPGRRALDHAGAPSTGCSLPAWTRSASCPHWAYPTGGRSRWPTRSATPSRRHGDPALLDGLDERLAGLADCGIPDTLLHGDLHPGNVRSATAGTRCWTGATRCSPTPASTCSGWSRGCPRTCRRAGRAVVRLVALGAPGQYPRSGAATAGADRGAAQRGRVLLLPGPHRAGRAQLPPRRRAALARYRRRQPLHRDHRHRHRLSPASTRPNQRRGRTAAQLRC